MTLSTCLNCGSSDMDRPLVPLQFQGKQLYICPQCLPELIHRPSELAEKLPHFTPSDTPPADDP